MQIRSWLDNLVESMGEDEIPLRVILKSGNELLIEYNPDVDVFGTGDELSNGNYMIDTRSIAAIRWVDPSKGSR